MEPGTLIQIILWGLVTGCIYILLASGLNVIFGVMKIVNFAQGELMVIGSYTTYWIATSLGLNPYISILLSMVSIAVFGVLVERLCFRLILGTSKLNEIFLSLGLIYLLQNTMASIWTDDWRYIRSPYEAYHIPLGPIRLPLDYIAIIFITPTILGGLYIFLRKTWIGMGVRATSQNRRAASLMGINVERMDMLSFGLGSALAAAAGALLAMSGQPFSPYTGTIPAVKAFAIIILGGLGSIPGSIVGGLIYGVAENIAAFFFGGPWKDATAFAILIVVLVIKPSGLFEEVAK